MKSSQIALLLGAALLSGAAAFGQAEANAFRLSFEYDRPGLAVPHWKLLVPPRGPAEYTGRPEKGNDPGQVLFALSPAGRAKLGDLLGRSKGLQPCETKSKNLANMGMKTVQYTAAENAAPAQCTFNYTDNRSLSEATDYVIAIVNTVQAGQELDRLHRYDRLGLDPVMQHLVDDAKSGRAVEFGSIRPTLQSLATDEAVMDRVRSRAQQLLQLAAQSADRM